MVLLVLTSVKKELFRVGFFGGLVEQGTRRVCLFEVVLNLL